MSDTWCPAFKMSRARRASALAAGWGLSREDSRAGGDMVMPGDERGDHRFIRLRMLEGGDFFLGQQFDYFPGP